MRDHLRVEHVKRDVLDGAAPSVEGSPAEDGTLEMIVRRPDLGAREVLEEGELVVGAGLRGDNYLERGNARTPNGLAHPEAQINLMNSRAADLVAAGDRSLWPLAGDQLFVDFDLTSANLPTGTRFGVGDAVLEVSAKPHTGCAKFADRFGIDASRWVNSSPEHRYRGINAMVVEPGIVRTGDRVRKIT